MADRMGYTEVIEAAGARFATDTCQGVIKGRFHAMAPTPPKHAITPSPEQIQNPPVALDDAD